MTTFTVPPPIPPAEPIVLTFGTSGSGTAPVITFADPSDGLRRSITGIDLAVGGLCVSLEAYYELTSGLACYWASHIVNPADTYDFYCVNWRGKLPLGPGETFSVYPTWAVSQSWYCVVFGEVWQP
jgi:hypothetical protein